MILILTLNIGQRVEKQKFNYFFAFRRQIWKVYTMDSMESCYFCTKFKCLTFKNRCYGICNF